MPPNKYELLDSDEYRLPEGMQRVGYDADTQVYTFQDADGSYWEGQEGNKYGQLHRVGSQATPSGADDLGTARLDFRRNYHDWQYMGPFLVMVVALLLLLFRYLMMAGTQTCGEGNTPYKVQDGDSCWKIATDAGTDLASFRQINPDVDCDRLLRGMTVCVPSSTVSAS